MGLLILLDIYILIYKELILGGHIVLMLVKIMLDGELIILLYLIV